MPPAPATIKPCRGCICQVESENFLDIFGAFCILRATTLGDTRIDTEYVLVLTEEGYGYRVDIPAGATNILQNWQPVPLP